MWGLEIHVSDFSFRVSSFEFRLLVAGFHLRRPRDVELSDARALVVHLFLVQWSVFQVQELGFRVSVFFFGPLGFGF